MESVFVPFLDKNYEHVCQNYLRNYVYGVKSVECLPSMQEVLDLFLTHKPQGGVGTHIYNPSI